MTYDNCISLGWFCGTASAMSKKGLRSCAGPFDWFFSDFEPVLYQIKTNFSEFMLKENLVEENDNFFRDKKFGFYCGHDIKEDFTKEYPAIYQKYSRRANCFMEQIKSPTIFFRCIRDEKEIEYINDNHKSIDELLKAHNENNEIVYLYASWIKGITPEVTSYNLQIGDYIGYTKEMRNMFDLCELSPNLLSQKQIEINKEFDKKIMIEKEKEDEKTSKNRT